MCVCEKLYVCERVCTPMCKCKVCVRNLRVLGAHPCVSVYVCVRNLSVRETVCMCACVCVSVHVCACVCVCVHVCACVSV